MVSYVISKYLWLDTQESSIQVEGHSANYNNEYNLEIFNIICYLWYGSVKPSASDKTYGNQWNN